MKALVIVVCLLSGCCPLFKLCPRCPQVYITSLSAFKVKQTTTSPKGLKLDLSEVPQAKIDLNQLDQRVSKMIACMDEELTKVNHRPPREWACARSEVEPFKWHWDCPTIKVVPAVTSKCSTEEMLPVLADPALCRAKGVEPTPECPCRWRTLVQDNGFVVITPPRMYLWELARVITGCDNLWVSPMARCLTP